MGGGGGSLIQLAARGVQDARLTGDPQFSYFKAVTKRHTPVAVESVRQTVGGDVRWGGRPVVTIGRNGDVLLGLTCELTMRRGPDADVSPFFPAEHLVAAAHLEIGGVVVATLTRDFLRVHHELFLGLEKRLAHARKTDFVDGEPPGSVKTFYLSLPFWFAKSPAQGLPMVALNLHAVRLVLELSDPPPGVDASFQPLVDVYGEFAFLGPDERAAMACRPLLYQIEQVQVHEQAMRPDAARPSSHRVPLTFNHPVRWMAWALCGPRFGQYSAGEPGDTADALAPVRTAGMQFNGIDRFEPRRGSFFSLVTTTNAGLAPAPAGLYFYSFGMWATKNSGTINLSRLDSAVLSLDLRAASQTDPDAVFDDDATLATAAEDLRVLRVFAVCANWLRVNNGMATLLYDS